MGGGKTAGLPPNFVFSPHDKHYYAPATCHSLHYTTASYVAAAVEFLILGTGFFCFYQMSHVTGSIEGWLSVLLALITACSALTTVLMAIGIRTERPGLLAPKLTFISLEIAFLLFWATLSIISMSVGIEFTRQMFGVFAHVWMIERDYGPIWPFNAAVVSFFTAAAAIWTRIIVQGACDFILDKIYFSERPNVEMKSKKIDE
ncbi:unnamed protein product [Caenorhabditis angaria]|uniref:Uncharacterized protein n=1 Tax=Caenorhabditis angaria TaxID=860376 RepID=A0A9P1I3A3_9PELO|nr:unnamed protein product [Caenorhabditis angaria]